MLLPAGIPRCRVLHTYTTLHLHTHITLHLPTVLSHSLSFLFSFALTLLTPALPLSPLWHTPPRPFPTHAIHLPLRLHCSTLSFGPSLSLSSLSLSRLLPGRVHHRTRGCGRQCRLWAACTCHTCTAGFVPGRWDWHPSCPPSSVVWTREKWSRHAGPRRCARRLRGTRTSCVCVCVCVCVEGAFGRTLENGPR